MDVIPPGRFEDDELPSRGPAVSALTFELGAVVTAEWQNVLSGKQHKVFIGSIVIRKDTDALGWEVTGRDSNWIASVSGKHHTIHIPGCQVVAIHEFRSSTGGLADIEGSYIVP